MPTLDRQMLADAAYEAALKLYATNYRVQLTARDKADITVAVLRLIEDGMTDKDFVASFAINRARIAR